MATSDGWLFLAIKLRRRNSLRIKDLLFPATTVGQQPGEARATRRAFKAVGDMLAGLAGGVYTGNVWGTVLNDSGTRPTGNIACVQANASGDTITFTYAGLTVVLTEGASGQNGFSRGASNTECAANLATCINNHPVLGGLVTALGATGNCGLTAKTPTVLLQNIVMSTSDATAFTFTQLTGGTAGTATIFVQQFWANRNR